MRIQELITEIEESLESVFADVDTWFDKPAALQVYCPANGGWTVGEILEHISLTSYYLLKLIDKGALKAANRARQTDLIRELENYQFEREKLDEIGIHRSFTWMRPEHMEPTGNVSLTKIRSTIVAQKNRCLQHLKSLSNGEGVLYKTTMTVNNLGKIDVYAYIYFLTKHAQRHLVQMERIEQEFNQ